MDAVKNDELEGGCPKPQPFAGVAQIHSRFAAVKIPSLNGPAVFRCELVCTGRLQALDSPPKAEKRVAKRGAFHGVFGGEILAL